MFFTCEGVEVKGRIVDTTVLALKRPGLPQTLGLRPQALPLKFVSPGAEGTFLAPDLSREEIYGFDERFKEVFGTAGAGQVYSRGLIGETLSLIHSPVFVKGSLLYDAITGDVLGPFPGENQGETVKPEEGENGHVAFVPALCPECGWNLAGERDSVVLCCGNCNTAWRVKGTRLEKVEFFVDVMNGKTFSYLPFYRMKVRIAGMSLQSYADLVKLANIPRAVRTEWHSRDVYFWVPAFKVRPDLFLKIGRLLTLTQPEPELVQELPRSYLYPVTLPAAEAGECLRTLIGELATAKKKIFPLLSGVATEVTGAPLIYLPFFSQGEEFVHRDKGLSIQRNALKYGRNL
jgi:hypothetical protein